MTTIALSATLIVPQVQDGRTGSIYHRCRWDDHPDQIQKESVHRITSSVFQPARTESA